MKLVRWNREKTSNTSAVFRKAILFGLSALTVLLLTKQAFAYRIKLTVADQEKNPLPNLVVKAIPVTGGKTIMRRTNDSGRAGFNLKGGCYRFRAYCLGYRFNSKPVIVPLKKRVRITIPQKVVTAVAQAVFEDMTIPLPDVPVVLKKPHKAAILAGPVKTSADGTIQFTVCNRRYFFEIDFLDEIYRSENFRWKNGTVDIHAGKLEAIILHGAERLSGAPVFVVSPEGNSTGFSEISDIDGLAAFYLPPGGYLLEVAHDDGFQRSEQFTIREGQISRVTLNTLIGHEPSIAFRSPVRQLPDGRDIVEISLTVSDEDGDGCRLRTEHSLDGETWSSSIISQTGLRTSYNSSGGSPTVDNGASFQIGSEVPIRTDQKPNKVTFYWEASSVLPEADNIEVHMRFTVSDSTNNHILVIAPASWSMIGDSSPGYGLSGSSDDSFLPSVESDSQGRPHAAWIESTPTGDALAYLRWDGHEWVDADGNGRESMIVHQTSGSIYNVSLSLDHNDLPRIAWDGSEDIYASVFYLAMEGNEWVGYDGRPGDAGPVFSWENDLLKPQLLVDSFNRPHLVFYEGRGNSRRIFHLILEDRRWVDKNGSDQSEALIRTVNGQIRGCDLSMDNRDRLHLVWVENQQERGSFIHHLYLESNEWKALREDGSSLVAGEPSMLPSLILGADDAPHIFWEKYVSETNVIRYSFWNNSAWTTPSTISGENCCCPEAIMLPGDKAVAAFLDYSTGSYKPSLIIKDDEWRPWPGFSDSVSPAVGDVYDISSDLNERGDLVLAFDNYITDAGEIHCASPQSGAVILDTALPTAPGPLEILTYTDSNEAVLSFGTPTRDDNFMAYFIEASPDPDFVSSVMLLDKYQDNCLSFVDFSGKESTTITGLNWGEGYFFRISAEDLAGHQSHSPLTGPVQIPEDQFPPEITIENPQNGTITPDRTILVRGTSDDPEANITVNGDAVELINSSFEYQALLDEGDNEMVVKAVDGAGNDSEKSVTVVSIPMEISSPPDGASVRGSFMGLEGTCGTLCSWITVGSLFATPENGRFRIPLLPLTEGENKFIIKAHDGHGRFSERTLTVFGVDGDYVLNLQTDPPSGKIPLEVNLTCVPSEMDQGAFFSWDADGDGHPEIEGEWITSITHIYQSRGVYYPEVVIKDSTGVIYRTRAVVNVHSEPVILTTIPALSPQGVALDGEGYLYISEEGANDLKILDPELQVYNVIEEGGGTALNMPHGLAADELGYIWLCDTGNLSIAVFDRDGNFHGRWGCQDISFEHISCSGSVCFSSGDGNNSLCRLERSMNSEPFSVETWKAGDLSLEHLGGVPVLGSLAMDNSGRLHVADPSGSRILSYADNDEQNGEIEYRSSWLVDFASPSGISFSSQTNEFAVIENSPIRIRFFDSQGQQKAVIENDFFGNVPLSSPADLAFRQVSEGTLFYIADTGNDRVVVILLPGEDPLKPVEDLKTGLIEGNTELILNSLHPIAKEDNSAFFEEISGHFNEAAAWFENVELVSMEGNTAICRAIKNCTIGEVDGDFEFEIILMKDEKGRWKILSF